MPGYDLDRFKDLEGVKGIQRVLERPRTVLIPIHHEAPQPEEKGPGKPDVEFQYTVIAAAPPPEEKPKTGRANVERQMVVMTRLPPKQSKPATMADVKI